jgi:hypothetical protein
MLRVSTALVALSGFSAAAHAATVVPTVYEAGHFFATPRTSDGTSLRILFDTGAGGANYWISQAAADRLGGQPSACKMPEGYIKRPRFQSGAGMPAAAAHCGDVAVVAKGIEGIDGIAGGAYLDRRLWTFDYPAGQLRVEDPSWRPGKRAYRLKLGLERSPDGGLAAPYPRVAIRVDGESIDVLLDTGATALPTDAGHAATHSPLVHGEGTTSYITTSILERWHAAHPDWVVVPDADKVIASMRIIQVPFVDIAGWRVGPVWFTERPDRNFGPKGMSQWMDQAVQGAVGANVLDAFVMTLDYRHARAWLDCPLGHCRATAAAPAPVKR